jgi:uncharacterized RDD family membrane protein YckC
MSAEEKRASRKRATKTRVAPPEKSAAPKKSAGKITPETISQLNRPEPVKRIAAGLVDGLPAYLIAFIPYLGGLISAIYLAIRDGLPAGNGRAQSLGKRLLGLRTIRLPGGEPCDYVTSVLRNLPFAVPALIMMRPGMGWILGSLIWGAAFLVEILLIIVDENGERLGDRLAKTAVVVDESASGRLS